ncbi:Cytochrome P450 2J2 [Labeo rohita]|uniref:Cytochrome P450 2J2 n=1 Tax=Labeo rohita TaxID=84645 RepID=A0ABQ8MKM4_LABRO|nr:Cytochrome P450 2J2 [Labeo rohita]
MLTILVLLCLGACLLYLQLRIRRYKNFPPGPTPVPFFGNLLQLDRTNPLKDFDKFAQRYGSVYGMFIGRQPAVVLTGQKIIREALITQAVEFAGRSDNMMVSHMSKNKGVVLANYGESWREHRRFALTTLRNFGLGKKSMEQRILEEVKYICSHLEESAESIKVQENISTSLPGKSIDPQHLYHQAASNIIASIIFGSRFNYQDEYFQTLITTIETLMLLLPKNKYILYEIAPVLRIFPLPFRKAFQYFGVINNHILKVVDEHKKSRVTGEPRDLIDCYLEEMEKGTIIIPYLSSALREESQWKFPHEFNPQNFLNDKGEFVKPDAFMPFSVGPRMCLGENLARMELFLILVTVLRRFRLVWPEDAGEPDFKLTFGGTQSVKPYRLTVQLRTPGETWAEPAVR